MLLQAALGFPDHEVVDLTLMDRRWPMVLDCTGIEEPLFSQGTFFNSRERIIAHDLDKVIFEKTNRERFEKVPHGRYINFVAEFLAADKGERVYRQSPRGQNSRSSTSPRTTRLGSRRERSAEGKEKQVIRISSK